MDGNLSGWLVQISIQHESVDVGGRLYIYIYTNIYTLTETKKYIAPEKFTQLKTQKDFPTIQFHVRFVSFREGSKNEGCPVGYARCPGGVLKELFFLGRVSMGGTEK